MAHSLKTTNCRKCPQRAILFEKEEAGNERRIELCIEEDEAPFGVLYIANDGNPFSISNFESLSNLGQSDKDPEKSIGNKGIGFRSVLEISKSPEIYSRSQKESPHFDGFCFRFNPSIIQDFGKPVDELMAGNDNPASPIDPGAPLVLWADEKYRAFRERCIKFEEGWLQQELFYLSPYLLPEPIGDNTRSRKILEYEKLGYASVIRLPFINEKARDSALTELDNLNENTALFLDRVKSFKLVIKQYSRGYLRSEEPRENDPEHGFEVFIIHDESEYGAKPVESIKRFWMWEKIVGKTFRGTRLYI